MAISSGSLIAPQADVIVKKLLKTGSTLPAKLREEILAVGAEAVPPLLEILEDELLLQGDSPGKGFAPIHAMELLSKLGALGAIEPMLQLLAATDWQDIAHDRAIVLLPSLGAAVLEPALRAYAESEEGSFRDSLRAVFGNLRVRDERVFRILLDQLEDDPASGAMNLADYGDPRALPNLSRTFDACEFKEDGPFANQVLIEIQDAIEELGGVLTMPQLAKLDRALEPRKFWRAKLLSAWKSASSARPQPNEPPARNNRLGRNERCWCGSGRKYKKCHLAAT